MVHHMGQALSLAIQLNRTMVLAPGPFNVVTFTATDRCLRRISMCLAYQCCRQFSDVICDPAQLFTTSASSCCIGPGRLLSAGLEAPAGWCSLRAQPATAVTGSSPVVGLVVQADS